MPRLRQTDKKLQCISVYDRHQNSAEILTAVAQSPHQELLQQALPRLRKTSSRKRMMNSLINSAARKNRIFT